MAALSLLLLPLGFIADYAYTVDWWTPETLTGTRLGIETALASFGIVGVASVLGQVLLGATERQAGSVTVHPRDLRAVGPLLVVLVSVFSIAFFVLHLNSFQATIAVLAGGTAVVWRRSPGAALPTVTSGALLCLLAIAVYNLVSVLTPGWVDAFYHFTNTPRILVLGVPIDDFIFYFGVGVFMSGLRRWMNDVQLCAADST